MKVATKGGVSDIYGSASVGSSVLDGLISQSPAATASHLAESGERQYCASKEDTALRYRAAVLLVRLMDRDGVVTYAGLAQQLKVGTRTVYQFFKRNRPLAKKWQILTEREKITVRLRAAARRIRKLHPGRDKIYRKELAMEADMSEKNLDEYLLRQKNHYLLSELEIAYTYPDYGSGKRGRKRAKEFA